MSVRIAQSTCRNFLLEIIKPKDKVSRQGPPSIRGDLYEMFSQVLFPHLQSTNFTQASATNVLSVKVFPVNLFCYVLMIIDNHFWDICTVLGLVAVLHEQHNF